MPDRLSLVFTCEHASPSLPASFRKEFRARLERMPQHRLFDRGAAALAERLSVRFRAPLLRSRFSRLLVDLNRSVENRELFSELSAILPDERKKALLARVYRPYRDSVERRVDRLIRRGKAVIHVSVHTFTPVLNGAYRKTEIGLLFDPSRSFEKRLCFSWRRRLKEEYPGLAVHFNRPYHGRSDGFTKSLREGRADSRYAGIEIEVNQIFFVSGRAVEGRRIRGAIVRSLADAVSDLPGASASGSIRTER